MVSKLDDLLPAIRGADDSGLTLGAIRTKFVDRSGPKVNGRKAELEEELKSLVRAGKIWGPLKHRRAHYYFVMGRGPSVESASNAVGRLVSNAGVKLLSKPGLEKRVTGMNGRFFADGLKHAIASGTIVELACGTSKYYLHRDVAKEYFGFEETPPSIETLSPKPPVTFETLLPVYRRLKVEQGGFAAVKIFDLMKALGQPKQDLHRLLLDEAKAGRVTIHPTTSVELPAQVIDAGIKLPNFPEPFVTVVVKGES